MSLSPSRRRELTGRFGIPASLSLVSFVIAFWQRPWGVYSDTRIEMVTNPGLLLSRVSQIWTSTVDLGHIQASQFVGYLFPMAPFFAGGDAVGLPLVVVQRLWIGLFLAIAAWGVVRLIEALRPSTGRAALTLAGLIYICSPFVTVSLINATIWLVPYALLPWMLLMTHRGITNPKSWRAPAVLAVLVAASSTAVTPLFWLLVAVGLLAALEAFTWAGLRALLQFTWRAGLLSILLSLWWIIPVVIQAKYGTDYLTFTEHPEAILHTPSASESLRMLGFWPSYVGGPAGTGPQMPSLTAYFFSAPTIAASFAMPALALLGLSMMRRWRYAGFFGLLLAFAVLAMSNGFPQEGIIGGFVTDLYYNSGPFQFLRTTYKAAPLAALSIAVLAGITLGSALDRVRQLQFSLDGRRLRTWWIYGAALLTVAGLVAFWGRPLWAGNALDARAVFSAVPAAWTDALDDAQTTTPADSRIAVLPGDHFATYNWASTEDSIAPGLSRRPVLIRQSVRSASPQAAQLLDGIDTRIQQGRLTPGQLPPLLQLMGVGRVLIGSDASPRLSDTLDAARTAVELQAQPGFEKPAATFGPSLIFSAPGDRGAALVKLPQVRAYAAPKPAYPRISRVHSAKSPTVVDGDADGVIGLAGVGSLDPRRASFYAADLDRASLARLLPSAPTLAFTDSNRRRGLLPAVLTTNTGHTLGAEEPLDRRFPDYDPFKSLGMATRTVAVYSGLRSLESPSSPGYGLFPEHRPFAALDGDLGTAWITDEDESANRYLQLNFARPISFGSIRIHPHQDFGGRTTRTYISVDGGPERSSRLRRGWNDVAVNARNVRSLRLRLPGVNGFYGVQRGGIDELRIPGLAVTEALRLPTRLASLAAGQSLSTSPFEIVAERVTADFPLRAGKPTGEPFALDPLDMKDAEKGMRRVVTLPEGRKFAVSGWGSVAVGAHDSAIDRIAGVPSTNRYESSQRFEGLPLNRASSAFDRDPSTAWISEFSQIRGAWIEWSGSQAVQLKRIRLVRAVGPYLAPARVSVATPSGGFDLPVRSGGYVVLPRTVVASKVRITVRSVKEAPRPWPAGKRPSAVAFSSVQIPGVPAVRPRRSGNFESGCPAFTVQSGGRSVNAAVDGDLAALDAGGALRVTGCGSAKRLSLKRGPNLLIANPGPIFTLDSMRMTAAAPVPLATAAPAPASISPSGKVALAGDGWLVLGESYSSGWKAWCTNRAGEETELGAPVQIDGFANGWRITGDSCRSARFAFGPQRYAAIGYWISGIGGTLVVALLLFAGWKRRRQIRPHAAALPSAPTTSVDIRRNAGINLAFSRVDQSGAGARADWRSSRVSVVLSLIAALAVTIVGVLYILDSLAASPIIYFDYPLDHGTEHWIAFIAMLALGAGSVINLIAQIRRRPRDG